MLRKLIKSNMHKDRLQIIMFGITLCIAAWLIQTALIVAVCGVFFVNPTMTLVFTGFYFPSHRIKKYPHII